MYMGVIPGASGTSSLKSCAPHVYGGDPWNTYKFNVNWPVLPMYMGVIPPTMIIRAFYNCAPHVYGGDPAVRKYSEAGTLCSPCIWG